jgi:hypothetical protein
MVSPRNRRVPVKFDWSHYGQCFVLRRTPVNLSRIYKKSRFHFLAECAVRQSRIRNAGSGIFLRQAASTGQILLRYGGRKISLSEADKLKNKVH